MPDREPYPIIHLHKDDVLASEEMGSKRKGWVRVPDDAECWLFKYARFSNGQVTGEHWAEKVAAEVADLLQIAHARVELATLEGSPGCISRRFSELAQPGAELIHGNDLLSGAVLGYDRTKQFRQSDHTVEHILAAISHVLSAPHERAAAFRQMGGYLILDAIILNTDRHHENWALVRIIHPDGRVSHNMAPTFDHASCLGRNEPPDKLAAWLAETGRPAWYAARSKCRGGIYLRSDDAHGANPLKLLELVARKWREYFAAWAPHIERVSESALCDTVDRVPDRTMMSAQREFAKALLRVTFQRVKDILL
jgi:HipA-like protein